MWILVLICSSVSCDADLVAVHYEYTEQRCIELAESVYDDMGYAWMCVKDKTSLSVWEEFE